jgi:flavin reductase
MSAFEAPETFIAAMGAAATGVSIITTDGPGGRFGLTVSAVTSVSADPPLLLVCVNRKSPAVPAITTNGCFALSILGVASKGVAMTFSGRPAEGSPYEFRAGDWSSGETGLPLLSDAVAQFECDLGASHDLGSHRVFVGHVRAARRGAAEPLVYSNRNFGRVAAL